MVKITKTHGYTLKTLLPGDPKTLSAIYIAGTRGFTLGTTPFSSRPW